MDHTLLPLDDYILEKLHGWLGMFSLSALLFITVSLIPGEAFLVTAGIVLYFGDMLLLTIKKVSGF